MAVPSAGTDHFHDQSRFGQAPSHRFYVKQQIESAYEVVARTQPSPQPGVETEADRTRKAREREQAQSDEPEHRQSAAEEPAMRDGVEITDAMQARLDRLREAKAGYSSGPGQSNPRDPAPGGGRSRGR